MTRAITSHGKTLEMQYRHGKGTSDNVDNVNKRGFTALVISLSSPLTQYIPNHKHAALSEDKDTKKEKVI